MAQRASYVPHYTLQPLSTDERYGFVAGDTAESCDIGAGPQAYFVYDPDNDETEHELYLSVFTKDKAAAPDEEVTFDGAWHHTSWDRPGATRAVAVAELSELKRLLPATTWRETDVDTLLHTRSWKMIETDRPGSLGGLPPEQADKLRRSEANHG